MNSVSAIPFMFGQAPWVQLARVWLFGIGMLLLPRGAGAELGTTGTSVNYLREIKPVFKARCYPCHGALKQQAGLRLDTAKSMRLGGKHGPAIPTNGMEVNLLMERIRAKDLSERMPPEGEALKQAEIEAIATWIANGGNAPSDEAPEPDPLRHWAFQKPVRPAIPAIPSTQFRLRTPIDAFVAAQWPSRGISPVPEADRSHLLRRVYLDLTGLPPSPEQLRHFLNDTRSDAYERVVDELLDSPRHGERWARHWMDVWRYADWFGRRHVPDVWNSAPQVWRWREWIIQSLNSDKGYDRMVEEMLAGDELDPTNDDVTVATGFLVRNWYALNPNQWMRETVEHTGKAFLGLTFNCAHCHDHKYDPISHKDYFRFRAFFEPLGLRQDWVAGESDPGPFQKYDYSTLRKVVKTGTIRVMDEVLDAKTYVYLRGDERLFPPDKPTVDPGPPAFLAPADFRIQPTPLPPTVQYPGLKPFIRTTLSGNSRNAVEKAEAEWKQAELDLANARKSAVAAVDSGALATLLEAELRCVTTSNRLTVARMDLASILARMEADDARYGPLSGDASGETERRRLAEVASRSGRLLVVEKSRLKLAELQTQIRALQVEQQVANVRRSAAGLDATKMKRQKEDDATALKALTDPVAQSEKTLLDSETAAKTNSTAYEPLSPVYSDRSTGRRTALARWIASRDNPLTARVAVNHVWQWHFQEPLVKSVQDFGRNGRLPTHPELLDWLAVELMEHGWSLKHLHRLMVTSSTYRLASSRPISANAASATDPDPENHFLGRMNLGRMESEVVRDSVLFVAGTLDLKRGGYPLANTESDTILRRSVYFECFPEEGGHDAFTAMFDPPDPGECYRRTRTILPQQSLALSNSALLEVQSRRVAERLWSRLDANSRTGELFAASTFEAVLNRPANLKERQLAREFLGETEDAQLRTSFVRALFNHNDFVTIR